MLGIRFEDGIGPRATALTLAAIIALAAILRVDRLGEAALSPDEGFSWRLARDPLAEITSRTAADVHPPLYYFALRGWVSLLGDSTWALRSLSVLCGVAVVPLLYLVVLDGVSGAGGAGPVGRSSALLAAFLLATNASEVAFSRTARMYPLGVLLAALGAWALLRALRPGLPRTGWWLAYGATASAFLWTHNAAAFTIAAQGAWVASAIVFRLARGDAPEARRRALGLTAAAAVVLVTYGPWIPVAVRQFGMVRREYWIAPLSSAEAASLLASWGLGLPEPGTLETLAALAVMVGAAGWVIVRRDQLGGFLLLQASTPWTIGLGIWLTTGRPILLERLLAFAQLAAFGTWAAAHRQIGDPVVRSALAVVLALSSLSGLADSLARRPPAPQEAWRHAAAYLGAEARPGDLVILSGPIAVNRLLHAMARAGVAGIDVRCLLRQGATDGHINHAASLKPEDILWTGPNAPSIRVPGRVWTVRSYGDRGADPALLDGRTRAQVRTFEAGGSDAIVTLYVRPDPGTGSGAVGP